MNTQNASRLWIQATSVDAMAHSAEESAAVAVVASMVSSGVGAVLQAASDRLLTEAEYTLSGSLAYEPAFKLVQERAPARFQLGAVIINVGPVPVELDAAGRILVAADERSENADTLPVVIRVEFAASQDGTALAGQVTHWIYNKCLDNRTAFRDKQRKISIEIKITDAAGVALLSTAMQVSATTDKIGTTRPSSGERLPWTKMPLMATPASLSGEQFGPVNIAVRITEAAGPSWLARLLGGTISSQKAALQTYVKDSATEAMDASTAAQAQLANIKTAQTTWNEYVAAYQRTKAAREAFDKENSSVTRMPLSLSLAALAEHQTLAREVHRRAGVPFQPLPPIPAL